MCIGLKSLFFSMMLCFLINGSIAHAVEYKEVDLHKMRATVYCLEGKTYTGKKVRKGICATGNKEWVGKTAILYERLPNDDLGAMIGIYEIEDTGCNKNVIDVWMPEEEMQIFCDRTYEDGCKGKVYVDVIDAVG